jgi:TonB family protein
MQSLRLMMRLNLRSACFGCAIALAGCASGPRSALIEPVHIEDASFMARGPTFAPGLYSTVRICVSPKGLISSAVVVLSSGDKRFDEYVLSFARRVKVQPQRINGRPAAGCDTVRVEINHGIGPGGGAGAGIAVG